MNSNYSSQMAANIDHAALRFNLYLITGLACLFQFFIDASFENVISTLIAGIVTVISFYVIIRQEAVDRQPIVSLVALSPVLGFTFIPLVFQTVDLKPIIYNLQVPIFSFEMIAYFQFAVLLAFILYVHSDLGRAASQTVQRKIWQPLGLYHLPSNTQLWLFAAIGILAFVVRAASQSTGGLEAGNAGSKFLDAFGVFAYAPFLIPIFRVFEKDQEKERSLNLLLLGAYFGFLLLVAIALNSRGAFATGVANIGLVYMLLFLGGYLKITKKIKAVLLTGALAGIFIAPMMSDLATAMLMVREERTDVSSMELIESTLDAYQDKEGIRQYRSQRDFLEGNYQYNEYYVDNPFMSRFIYLKFTDNILFLPTIQDGNHSDEFIEWFKGSVMALFPQPLVHLFEPGFEKLDYAFSFGDYAYYVNYGFGIGGYRVGSNIGHAYGTFGYYYIFLMVPFLILLFIVLGSFNRMQHGQVILAPVIMLNFMGFYNLIISDSFVYTVGFIIRELPQTLILYLILFNLTRFTNLKWAPKVRQ